MSEGKQIAIFKLLAPLIELVVGVFGIFGTTGLAIPLAARIVIYVLGGLLGVYIIFSLIKAVKYYLSIDNDKSTIGSVKLKKHVKDLKKIAKVNRRVFRKEKQYSDNYSETFKKNVRKIFKEDAISEHPNKEKNTGYSQKKFFHQVLKEENAIFSLDGKLSFKACQEISDCILDVDHVLLSSNQYVSRIFFGIYLTECHVNYFDKINAEVDMLGWTYALAGKKSKSENILHEAIDELKLDIESINEVPTAKSSKEVINFYYNANLYLQRAYRHLAANPKIRRSSDLKENIENLDKAREALSKFYIDEKKKIFQPYLTESQCKEITRNRLGITFGYVETYYDFARQESHKKKNFELVVEHLKQSIYYFNELIVDKNELDKIDKHRELNLTIIANKILFLIEIVFGNDREMPDIIAEYAKNFKHSFETDQEQIDNSLDEIKSILKSAIYVDQAIESFIQQRVFQCYKKVGKIYQINYGDHFSKKGENLK